LERYSAAKINLYTKSGNYRIKKSQFIKGLSASTVV